LTSLSIVFSSSSSSHSDLTEETREKRKYRLWIKGRLFQEEREYLDGFPTEAEKKSELAKLYEKLVGEYRMLVFKLSRQGIE